MKVYKTLYDGFYVSIDKGKICAYEGLALCPPKVKKWIEKNKAIEINYFQHEAIAFGKIVE